MENAVRDHGPRRVVTAPRSGCLPGSILLRVLDHIDTNVHRDPRLIELSALVHMNGGSSTRRGCWGMAPCRSRLSRALWGFGRRVISRPRFGARPERAVPGLADSC